MMNLCKQTYVYMCVKYNIKPMINGTDSVSSSEV